MFTYLYFAFDNVFLNKNKKRGKNIKKNVKKRGLNKKRKKVYHIYDLSNVRGRFSPSAAVESLPELTSVARRATMSRVHRAMFWHQLCR